MTLNMAKDDPRAPYKVYEGDECKGTYRHARKRGEHNSNLANRAETNLVIRDVLGDVVS